MTQVVITSEKGLSEPEKQEIAKLWSTKQADPDERPSYPMVGKR